MVMANLHLDHHPLPFSNVSAVLFAYGVMLFVLLSEAMLRGVANFLTAKRGEKWTTEIDYIYLAIGSIGILASLSRIEVLTGRVAGTEILAPLVLTTAIVIRFIKTGISLPFTTGANELIWTQRLICSSFHGTFLGAVSYRAFCPNLIRCSNLALRLAAVSYGGII
jgi:hypothetical protein